VKKGLFAFVKSARRVRGGGGGAREFEIEKRRAYRSTGVPGGGDVKTRGARKEKNIELEPEIPLTPTQAPREPGRRGRGKKKLSKKGFKKKAAAKGRRGLGDGKLKIHGSAKKVTRNTMSVSPGREKSDLKEEEKEKEEEFAEEFGGGKGERGGERCSKKKTVFYASGLRRRPALEGEKETRRPQGSRNCTQKKFQI